MEATHRQTNLTPLEQRHTEFMQRLASSLSDTPSVLKGGTALMLAYGLNRFSEDLDFDSTKALNLEKKITDAADKEGIKIESIKIKKDTDTTKRYVVFYESELGAGRLKIETSLRHKAIAENETTIINGIRTYNVKTLVSQKLEALNNRSKVRDLYDINFLSEEHPDAFSKEQVKKLKNLTKDPDLLTSRFEADHSADNILKNQPLDNLVLGTRYNAESLLERAQNINASNDFKSLKEVDFLKKHPSLAPHIATLKTLEKEVSSNNLTSEQNQIAMQRIRDSIATSIRESAKPSQTINQTKDLHR